MLRPIITRTPAFRSLSETTSADSTDESVLYLLLMLLGRFGVEFDPEVIVDGAEFLPRAGDAQPCFIACAHTNLVMVLGRLMFDRGVAFAAVATGPLPIVGTRNAVDILTAPSPDLLVRVRNRFRRGGVIVALIDRIEPERRTRTVASVAGSPLYISTALVHLALRVEARIVFASAHLDGRGRVVVRLCGATEPKCHDVAVEFAQFVDIIRQPSPSNGTSQVVATP